MGLLSPLLVASLGLLRGTSAQVIINAPAEPPTTASAGLDPAFLGIMVESTSWPWYGTRNGSQVLLTNIMNRTGELIVRVGGTSGDHAFLDPNQVQALVRQDPNDTDLKANVTFGQQWLQGFADFPKARYVVQVPLARRPMSKAVQFATDSVKYVRNLEAIEIGNEPDLYNGQANIQAPKNYDQTKYANDFQSYSAAINAALPDVRFQAGGLADYSSWSAQSVYDAGLKSSKSIKTFAMHYYSGNLKDSLTLRGTFLNHTAMNSRLGRLRDDIAVVRARNTPFIIEELGSILGSSGGVYEAGIDKSLGSALWAIDVLLQSQAWNVSRVNMNECNGCAFASWWAGNPTNGGAAVFSQYYALVFVADWIESGMRVSSLYDNGMPKISPYAGYRNGVLDRYVIIDLNESNATSSRVERTFQVSVPGDVKTAELRRLTAGDSNTRNATYLGAADMVYAGTRYSSDSPEGVSVGPVSTSLAPSGGKISFQLAASEAVLILLRR